MADLQALLEKLSGTKAGQTAGALLQGGSVDHLDWPDHAKATVARTRQMLMPVNPVTSAGNRTLGAIGEAVAPSITSLMRGEPARPVPEVQGITPRKVLSAEDPRLSGVGEDIFNTLMNIGPVGRRAMTPWSTEDVPLDKQILR